MGDPEKDKAWRRCPECLEPVGFMVRICPVCKSYQDWRRYVAIGQTNIALLVALISVTTTAITVGLPFTKVSTSNISALAVSNNQDRAVFLAQNIGRSSGAIKVIGFEVKVAFPLPPLLVDIKATDGNALVEPDKDAKIEATMEPNDVKNFCPALKKKYLIKDVLGSILIPEDEGMVSVDEKVEKNAFDRLSCSFSYTTQDFTKETPTKSVDVPCRTLHWVKDCIFETLQ